MCAVSPQRGTAADGGQFLSTRGSLVRGTPKLIGAFGVYIFLGKSTMPSTSFSKRPRATIHY